MCNLVAAYRKMARDNRLMFEKIVKTEKENRRAEIVTQAQMAITNHIRSLNERIGGPWMPVANFAPFAEAVKGLKSLDSMRDKVSTAFANAKIEANAIADRIEFNAKQITVDGANYNYLVHDFAQICTKPTEDFAAIMAQRIAAHKAAEAEKIEAAKKAEDARVAAAVEAERLAGEARAADEAERIRKEEAAKLTASNQTQFEAPEPPVIVQTQPAQTLAPEAKRAVLVEAGDEVRSYLNTLGLNDKEFGRLRAVILGWEQHKAELAMRAAA
jgi:hypothetical protein